MDLLDKQVVEQLQQQLLYNLEMPPDVRDVVLVQALHKVLQYYMPALEYNYFISHIK